jgi:ribonuclease R
LIGERSGHTYSLGEQMRIRVHRVDMETRKIDFRPIDDEGHEPSSKRPSGAKRPQGGKKKRK